MSFVTLSPWDVAAAALLMLALAGLSRRAGLGVERELLVSAARMVVQLALLGLVLELLFARARLVWVAAMALGMLALAGREAVARQERRFRGAAGYLIGTLAMFVSSFALCTVTLVVLIRAEPWYAPQYAIPLLGMILGNTLTGVSLGLDRLTQNAWEQRDVIEQRLLLGETASQALVDIRRHAARSGLIPIINAMAVAGVVSLPGMMTGQILAGAPPAQAVKYQILIMFLISAGTGFGTLAALGLGARRLFDERERLRLERLAVRRSSR